MGEQLTIASERRFLLDTIDRDKFVAVETEDPNLSRDVFKTRFTQAEMWIPRTVKEMGVEEAGLRELLISFGINPKDNASLKAIKRIANLQAFKEGIAKLGSNAFDPSFSTPLRGETTVLKEPVKPVACAQEIPRPSGIEENEPSSDDDSVCSDMSDALSESTIGPESVGTTVATSVVLPEEQLGVPAGGHLMGSTWDCPIDLTMSDDTPGEITGVDEPQKGPFLGKLCYRYHPGLARVKGLALERTRVQVEELETGSGSHCRLSPGAGGNISRKSVTKDLNPFGKREDG
jgi:hypothetical protein